MSSVVRRPSRDGALPWNELTYDTSLGGNVVNRTQEQLEGHPAIPLRSCNRGTMRSTAGVSMTTTDWAEAGSRVLDHDYLREQAAHFRQLRLQYPTMTSRAR
jgi:hypothetical protein